MDADDEITSLGDLRAGVGDLAGFVADVGRLLTGLLRDPRVPRSAKVVALGAAGYVLSPLDVIPDVLPGIGFADDLWLLRRALRLLLRRAGVEVVRDHWHGTEEGFSTLLAVAGAGTGR